MNEDKPQLKFKPAFVGMIIVGFLCWWGLIHLAAFIVSLFNR